MKKNVSYDEKMRELVENSNDIPEDLDEDLPQETQLEIEKIAKVFKENIGNVREKFNDEYRQKRINDNLSEQDKNEMYARMLEEEWSEEG
jgi:F0F1-type ATP synthase membrane subunit b/b'